MILREPPQNCLKGFNRSEAHGILLWVSQPARIRKSNDARRRLTRKCSRQMRATLCAPPKPGLPNRPESRFCGRALQRPYQNAYLYGVVGSYVRHCHIQVAQ
jgi:hypothetical protein